MMYLRFPFPGVRGLWAGCLPNIQRAFIVNAFELGTYDQAKETLVNDFGFVISVIPCYFSFVSA
jgi:hypothetical protein